MAGFTLPPAPQPNQLAALSAVALPAITDTEDEDAAEARARRTRISPSSMPWRRRTWPWKPSPPRPTPVAAVPPALAKAASAPIPAIRPSARPDVPEAQIASAAPAIRPQARPAQTADAPTQMAMLAPQAKFTPAPTPKPVVGIPKMRPATADLEQATDHNWTIQIGTYADQALAKAQLDTYAEKSMDVLGQASRLVVPFQGANGHTMYRARFGLFAERQAREVCDRLTQRGQTCFAAVAQR